jgi:hypothetical protein
MSTLRHRHRTDELQRPICRYAKRSKISEPKFRQLVRLFALNLEATQFAELTGLNRNTVNRFLRAIRERLATFYVQQSPLVGEIEVDEFFFGPRRVKGKRGRGAYGKRLSSVSSSVTKRSTPK